MMFLFLVFCESMKKKVINDNNEIMHNTFLCCFSVDFCFILELFIFN